VNLEVEEDGVEDGEDDGAARGVDGADHVGEDVEHPAHEEDQQVEGEAEDHFGELGRHLVVLRRVQVGLLLPLDLPDAVDDQLRIVTHHIYIT